MDGFSINFYLSKVKSKNTQFDSTSTSKAYTRLMVSVAWNNLRVRTTLNISLDEKLWDKNKQRVKASAENPRRINDKLEEIRVKLSQYYDHTKQARKTIPTQEEVKNLIDALRKDIEVPKSYGHSKEITFMQYFSLFIRASETGDRLSEQGKTISQSTLKSYNTTHSHLEDFQESKQFLLSFDNIAEDFFSKFTEYMAKKGISNNSLGRNIKIIKTMMHWTYQKGYHNNQKFVKALPVWNEETTIIALTEDELADLENLPEMVEKQKEFTQRLRNLHALFLVQIYTGLRYSDLANIKKENIDFKNEIIRIKTLKTQDDVMIPITNKLKKLLEQHTTLPKYSNQKYNDGVKELCKLAGIDTPVQTTKYLGTKRVDETRPKYELVSSHTARRTFITISLKKGILPEKVMKISGHKSRKTFDKYVRITEEEAIRSMRDAWNKE